MTQIQRAAEAIAAADALFISAGAGMGVDSGLPDFRGDKGFWRAYPAFQKLGLNFVDMANPTWFSRDPELAWGFYGHRLHLYRDTTPHAGFALLRKWGRAKPGGHFVFTSNVDGQFQAAGFAEDRVVECHGSIHHLQCTGPCDFHIWSAGSEALNFDPTTFRAEAPMPRCPGCGALARPNILMFGDAGFVGERSDAQEERLRSWLTGLAGANAAPKLAIIECGAGTAVPTVRWQSERLARAFDAPLIRINPREAHGPGATISVDLGAADALAKIDAILGA
ncbi:SIR2 family NAD-dependent protein deacylase [Bradymonas sediminis]|uniref:NAD-dependent deacetylase n=1 Tax=Bradymonas sediminis TaxID=1548548 RepID=A0A2Z4FI52_9DELT|nr:Sir2 family NAD-dependent protein deacetylase [Bradymonas sediminis]AWV88589.1 NAD-dependent deacetylase [Bradymonas sediminis]TDP77733.1 Sir2 family protein [Bradymonas sediminis]